MRFIADFHIHSHFSIATSKQLIPEYLDLWARIKGIQVIGTGDFSHPGWIDELEEKLEPAEHGLYKLKKSLKLTDNRLSHQLADRNVRFMLTAEISNIYKKNGKVRKVHNVLFAPDFETVRNFQNRLATMKFNITSDGRPILGLDSRDLLEISLEINEDIFFVPAHIWTPWFSALGAKSGFDTIDECYDDLAQHIYAVETGLSSDPAMNWMCGFLDRFTLISNSDAHSPEKLGREANYFDTDMNYPAIIQALKDPTGEAFRGTIEFFPQEGKYHFDGHRKCNIAWTPVETLANKGICSVCGKPVTVGVMNRAAVLADRDSIDEHPNQKPFDSIIPLKEMISEIEGVGPNSKTVARQYNHLIQNLGSEFDILLQQDTNHISSFAGDLYGEAISRMRQRKIHIQEGFDGEFGVIKVFHPEELKKQKQQSTFFSQKESQSEKTIESRDLIPFDLHHYRELLKQVDAKPDINNKQSETKTKEGFGHYGLNEVQQKAVEHINGPMIILAGPGTGKTRTLAARVSHLINQHHVNPKTILTITFTNKAAAEMCERIDGIMQNNLFSREGNVFTFHGLGHCILTENSLKTGRTAPFTLIDEADKKWILNEHLTLDKSEIIPALELITHCKQTLKQPEAIPQESFRNIYIQYESWLKEHNAFDLDDLLTWPVHLFMDDQDLLHHYQQRFKWILVDEYQDLNEAQYQLIRLLMPMSDSNLCVIGDPNQAIYGFRGADNRYIQKFQNDYPEAQLYQLAQSYRCSKHILNTSSQLLADERLITGLHQGVRVQIASQPTDKSEAEFIARTIESMIGGLRFFSMDSQISTGNNDANIESLSDFAVLCRTHQQTTLLEKAFIDHSIPFLNTSNQTLFDQEPVKSILDVLRAAHMAYSDFYLLKITKKHRLTPGDQTSLLASILTMTTILEKLDFIQKTLYPRMTTELDAGYLQLLDIAKRYNQDIQEFLNMILLGSETDLFSVDTEAVHLMTLHASKGLEFKCVFIAGCEDNLLPYSIFNKPVNVDEEKRLLYVGMTRAQHHLILSHAEKRMTFGRMMTSRRSRFIEQIETELLEIEGDLYEKKKRLPEDQMNLF